MNSAHEISSQCRRSHNVIVHKLGRSAHLETLSGRTCSALCGAVRHQGYHLDVVHVTRSVGA